MDPTSVSSLTRINHEVLNENKVTNFMKQNPSSETDSRSASQEILHPLWKPNVHLRFHNSGPCSEPAESNPHPYTLFYDINFNINLLSTNTIKQLTVVHLIEKVPSSLNQRFITMFTTSCHWDPFLRQLNPIHTVK
jgi:hypothetical protein